MLCRLPGLRALCNDGSEPLEVGTYAPLSGGRTAADLDTDPPMGWPILFEELTHVVPD